MVWSDATIGNTPSPTNLSAGTYTLTVTDANGCTATSSVTINGGANITITLTPTNGTCGDNNGSISTSVSGGTAPYTYAWNDATIGNIANPANLTAGTYNLTITDANGCSATSSTTINNGSAVTVTLTPTDVTCGGANDGSITSTISGGTAPYTYAWSDVTIGNIGNPTNLPNHHYLFNSF